MTPTDEIAGALNDANSSKLTVSTPSDREIRMERVFDAPRELVYRAFTDPQLVPRWWGFRNSKTVVDKMDVRPGGSWRYVQVSPDGTEHAFRGEYREVSPPNDLPGRSSMSRWLATYWSRQCHLKRSARTVLERSPFRPSTRPKNAMACSNPAWRPAQPNHRSGSRSCLRRCNTRISTMIQTGRPNLWRPVSRLAIRRYCAMRC